MEQAFYFTALWVYWSLTLYEWMLMLAILLTWVQPDPRNAVVAFLNNMTVPFWNWLSRPFKGRLRFFGAYLSLLVVWFAQISLPGILRSCGTWASGTITPNDLAWRSGGFVLLGLASVLQNVIMFLMMLLVVWFILTLVNPDTRNPLVQGIYLVVDPLIAPVQKLLPRMRMDVSPLVVALMLLLASIYLVRPVVHQAKHLTISGGVGLHDYQVF